MTGPLLLDALLLSLALQTTPPPPPQAAAFDSLSSEFIPFHLYFNPVTASYLGEQGYDTRLPDVSRSGIEARSQAYQTWLERVTALDPSSLQGDAAVDVVLMENGIRATLLDLVEVRSWERDPAWYVDLLDRAIVPLLRGGATPARPRMNALTARLRQTATVLAEARSNLSHPPALFTERAAEGALGLAAVLRTEASAAFREVDQGPAKDDFLRAVARATDELEGFAGFLSQDLLPRSDGELALGPECLGWLLRYREDVTQTPEALLPILEREMDAERTRLETAARRLDASRRPADVVADVMTRTLPRAEAERTALATQDAVRRFVFRSLVLTVPSDRRPDVLVRAATSPWELSGLRAPGPFSPDDGPAELTLLSAANPDGGPGAAVAAALVLEGAFPGTFVEFLYGRRAPTRLRKLFRPQTLRGGWGYYSAAALMDDGFDEGPADLQVASLARRLQALAEARASLLIHLGRESADDAVDQVARDAYLPPMEARSAARQAAHRPFERGILGALALRQLREDFFRGGSGRGSEKPTERRFHDAFLATGLPPSLARRVLLPGDASPELR